MNISGLNRRPVKDDDKPSKKDSINKAMIKKEESDNKPIGSKVEPVKKKRGFFQKLFGKKDKN